MYYTIHVTSQVECSYVSFETNYIDERPYDLAEKVLDLFQPTNFTLTLFTNKVSKTRERYIIATLSYVSFLEIDVCFYRQEIKAVARHRMTLSLDTTALTVSFAFSPNTISSSFTIRERIQPIDIDDGTLSQ